MKANTDFEKVLILVKEGLIIKDALIQLNLERTLFYKNLSKEDKKELKVNKLLNNKWTFPGSGMNHNYANLDKILIEDYYYE